MTTGGSAGQATRRLTGLYQRFRHLIHEGAKFGIVGGTGVIIVLAGSDALRFDLGLGKFKSVTIATIVATVFTFLGNRYWSFRHRKGAGARSETLMFFVLNGVGLLIQYACIALVTDVAGLSARIWYTAANMVGIGIGTLFRFWSYRKWIWITPEAYLAKLRRGRHRKGRTAPVTATQPRQPVRAFQPGQSFPPGQSFQPPQSFQSPQSFQPPRSFQPPQSFQSPLAGQPAQLTKLPVRQPTQPPPPS